MEKTARENKLNIAGLLAVWFAFLLWCWVAGRYLSGFWLVSGTAVASLLFLQYLSGVIHEAAHGNFIRGNPRANDSVANWLGAHVFLYGLDAYRTGHFAHHSTQVFMIAGDRETSPYMGGKTKGLLRDVFLITAFQMFVFRTESSRLEEVKTVAYSRLVFHGIYELCFLGLLFWLGSPLCPIVFVSTQLILYGVSNRMRIWATHADLLRPDGLTQSTIARNLHSPWWERGFFGNRMTMYHHEHHLMPNLTFRECERRAMERDTTDLNISAPGYFFCVKKLFARRRPG